MTKTFDFNAVITGMTEAFGLVDSKETAEQGYALFTENKSTLKAAGFTVFSDEFIAALKATDKDEDTFLKSYSEIWGHLEQKALKRDAEKFSTQVKAALEEAKKNGESSCTIAFVPHRVFRNFTGHIGNRDVKDHVKGTYLKGKIDPVKRADFRKVTVLKLDPQKNAALWAEILKSNPVHSLPYILGDSHCRQYATCVAEGEQKGFRMENPGTWEVTVIEGLTDKQTVDYIRFRGNKDSQLSAKDARVIAMKEHKINPATASKFVLSPWKTAFKVAGIPKGDEFAGMKEFKDAINAIDTLKISLTKGGKASQGVKAAMLKTHKDCKDDDSALSKWVSFWSMFFNDEADHPKKMNTAIKKLGGAGYGSEALTLVALVKVYESISVEELKEEPEDQAA